MGTVNKNKISITILIMLEYSCMVTNGIATKYQLTISISTNPIKLIIYTQ